jgi:hypothetical protein
MTPRPSAWRGGPGCCATTLERLGAVSLACLSRICRKLLRRQLRRKTERAAPFGGAARSFRLDRPLEAVAGIEPTCLALQASP